MNNRRWFLLRQELDEKTALGDFLKRLSAGVILALGLAAIACSTAAIALPTSAQGSEAPQAENPTAQSIYDARVIEANQQEAVPGDLVWFTVSVRATRTPTSGRYTQASATFQGGLEAEVIGVQIEHLGRARSFDESVYRVLTKVPELGRYPALPNISIALIESDASDDAVPSVVKVAPYSGLVVKAPPAAKDAVERPMLSVLYISLGALVVLSVILVFGFTLLRRSKKPFLELERYDVPPGLSEKPERTEDSPPPENIVAKILEGIGGSGRPVDPIIPAQLIEACAAGNCVLVLGKGIGVSAGLPDWPQVLGKVISSLSAEEPGEKWSTLSDMLKRGEVEAVEDLLTSRASREKVIELVGAVYRSSRTNSVPKVLSRMRNLRFSGVISLAWDDFADRGFAPRSPATTTSRTSTDFSALLRSDRFFLLKAYGSLADAQSVLLTRDDYRRTIKENEGYQRFVVSLFNSKTFLFLGVSRPSIERFLVDTEIWTSSSTRHFAVVPDEPTNGNDFALRQERFAAKFNLELLPYGQAGLAAPLERFVVRLGEAVPVGEGNASSTAVSAETISRLRMENIGTFTQVDLPLNSGWNILLGDNGCGKSTILRAIALCLCGTEKTESAANNLLRVGADKGFVELYVGSVVYRTDLSRDGNKVKARSATFTAVQSGQWPALGFPALRGASIKQLKGPSNDGRGAANPVVEDLLPLLNEDIDTRFDGLKQRLINAAVLIAQKDSKGAAKRKMIDDFFKIMSRLTPNSKNIRYKGFTQDPWDIEVETDDGVVRIGMISQGMSSVFSWVGTLLMRINEIYPNAENPLAQKALVLVDELDAHLHPEWQAAIVGLLRDTFPNLQVIATTHSPLVVGNAQQGEVWVLKRKPEGVTLNLVEHSFEGWRADQILTADAFGMSNTRDKKTQQKLVDYKSLLGRVDTLNDSEKLDIDRLAAELDAKIPSYQELQSSRDAAGLVGKWLDDQIQQKLVEMPEERKQEVLQEAQMYLAKMRGDAP